MSSNMKKWLSLISTLAVAFVMCLGIGALFSSNAYANTDPYLTVSYKETTVNFFLDEDEGSEHNGQIYYMAGENKKYIDNTTVDLYTAIKNTGCTANVPNETLGIEKAYGPAILDILKAIDIDYSTFSEQKITFTSGTKSSAFKWKELFDSNLNENLNLYAFPNAKRSETSGDKGAAVDKDEYKGAVEVPAILNLKPEPGNEPQLSFGQVYPSQRNKPGWLKNIDSIVIEDDASFTPMPNKTDENISVLSGSDVIVGDEINFGGDNDNCPYSGTIYYTTDGTDPDQNSAIYNWDTYKGDDGFHYNPIVVEDAGPLVIKTIEYKYGYEPSSIRTFTYTAFAPFTVSYNGTDTVFYHNGEQLYTGFGTGSEPFNNTEVDLYTAIKNTGSADNVPNEALGIGKAIGPAVLDILSKAKIDYSAFGNQKISFLASDGKGSTFKWNDLFGSPLYAFPNADRPGDPGDQGAAAGSNETEGKVQVPVILNFKSEAGTEPQLSYGQASPNERNKPGWVKNTVKIKIEDVTSFDEMPNKTDENVSVPSGSTVEAGDVIDFGLDNKSCPYEGTIYYTTDGTDPDQNSAIYNWYAYKKSFKYNPIEAKEAGDLVIKTVEYKYGYEPSKINTFNYTVMVDLSKDGNVTVNNTTVGTKPTVTVTARGKTLKEGVDFTLSITGYDKIGSDIGKVTVTGKGNYKGTVSKSFTVTAIDLSKTGKMTLSKTKVSVGAKPTVKVVAGGKILKADTDYTYTINTKKIGVVKATVTGKGNYNSKLTKSVTVIPAKAKIAKATAGKKKVTVVIKSQKASGVTKYQIKYKLKTAKKWKTITTKSTKKVIKKLKKGKNYNIKVRAYGKTGYGAYSAVKTVKIK